MTELIARDLNRGFAAGYDFVPVVSVRRNALGQLTGGAPSEGRLQVEGYDQNKKIAFFNINAALLIIQGTMKLFADVDDAYTPLSEPYIETYAVISPLALVSSNRAGTEETSLPGKTVKLKGHFQRFKSTIQLNMETIWSAGEGDQINQEIYISLVKSMAVRIAQGHLRAVITAFRSPEFAEQHYSLTGVVHRVTAATEIVSRILLARGTPNINPTGKTVVILPAIFQKLGSRKELDVVYGELIVGMTERVGNVSLSFYNDQLLKQQFTHAPAATTILPTNSPDLLNTYLIGPNNNKIPLQCMKLLDAPDNNAVQRTVNAFFMALGAVSKAMKTRAADIVDALPDELTDDRMERALFLVDHLTNGALRLGVVGAPVRQLQTIDQMIQYIFTAAAAPGGGVADQNDLGLMNARVNYNAPLNFEGMRYDNLCRGFRINCLERIVEAVEAMLTQGTFPGVLAVYQEQRFVTHPGLVLLGDARMRIAWHQLQLGTRTDEIHQTDTRQIVSQIAVVPNTAGGLHHIPYAFISADVTHGSGAEVSAGVHYVLCRRPFENADAGASAAMRAVFDGVMRNQAYRPGDFIVIGFPFSVTRPWVNARPNGIQVAEKFGAPSIFKTTNQQEADSSIFSRSVTVFESMLNARQYTDEEVEHFTYHVCQLLSYCRGSEDPKFHAGTLAHTYNTYTRSVPRQTDTQTRLPTA